MGGHAGPDALSRAGVVQHPKRQEVHKGNLSCRLTCAKMFKTPQKNTSDLRPMGKNPQPCTALALNFKAHS